MNIVKVELARKIIKLYYGLNFDFKILTKSTTLGVRAVYETQIGLPTLAWIKNSDTQMVSIGSLNENGTIDWNWQPEEYCTGYDGNLYKKQSIVTIHPDCPDGFGNCQAVVQGLVITKNDRVRVKILGRDSERMYSGSEDMFKIRE